MVLCDNVYVKCVIQNKDLLFNKNAFVKVISKGVDRSTKEVYLGKQINAKTV